MTIAEEDSESRLALRLEELQLPVLDAVSLSSFVINLRFTPCGIPCYMDQTRRAPSRSLPAVAANRLCAGAACCCPSHAPALPTPIPTFAVLIAPLLQLAGRPPG